MIQQHTQHILYYYGLRHTSSTYRYFLKLTRKMFCNELKMGQLSKHLWPAVLLYYDQNLAGFGLRDWWWHTHAPAPTLLPPARPPPEASLCMACSDGVRESWKVQHRGGQSEQGPRVRVPISARSPRLLSEMQPLISRSPFTWRVDLMVQQSLLALVFLKTSIPYLFKKSTLRYNICLLKGTYIKLNEFWQKDTSR